MALKRIQKDSAILLQYLDLTAKVAAELAKNGYTLLDITVEADSKPRIQICHTPRCRRLGGSIIRHVHQTGAQFQEWHSEFSGVRVIWHEPVAGITA